eukprot:6210544-Pleurochrysis_carterae.AAC.3
MATRRDSNAAKYSDEKNSTMSRFHAYRPPPSQIPSDLGAALPVIQNKSIQPSAPFSMSIPAPSSQNAVVTASSGIGALQLSATPAAGRSNLRLPQN